MDAIDNKILRELDLNPKISLTQLARRIRISQQVADYRIKKLMKDGKITKLGTIVNLKALGLEHYRIFFTFNAKKSYSNKDIFQYLERKKGVYWVARTGGKYDLHVTLFVFDFEELDNFIDDFNDKFPGLIKDHNICYTLEHFIYRHKYLGESISKISYGYKDKIQTIDALDREILQSIKDNCRLSSLKTVKDGRVSYKTVLNRIKIMEMKKIILGYRMFIRSEEKKPFIVLVSFRDYSKNEESKLLSYLENHRDITQVLRLFGSWNLYLHVRTEDMEKLQQIIIEMRDKFSIIDNFESIPVFEDIGINLFPQ